MVKVGSLHLISFFLLENLQNKLIIFAFFKINDVINDEINDEHIKDVEMMIFVSVVVIYYCGYKFRSKSLRKKKL